MKFFTQVFTLLALLAIISCGLQTATNDCEIENKCRNDSMCAAAINPENESLICYSLCNKGEDCKKNQECILLRDQENQEKNVCYECSLGYSGQCTYLGAFYIDKKNYAKAKSYLEKACDFASGDGCGFLGFLYEEGNGTEINIGKAKEFYGKGCQLKSSYTCGLFGQFYEKRKEYQEATIYYNQSCELSQTCKTRFCKASSAISCSSLGDFYTEGKGLVKDCEKANFYYEKSCKLGQPTCSIVCK